MVAQSIQNIFEKIIEEKGLYAQCSRGEIKLILRYHVGLFWGCFKAGGRRTPKTWIRSSIPYFC